jgi:hypothetical protein
VVLNAALTKLDDLYLRGITPTSTHVTLVDGMLGTLPLL